LAEAPLVLVSFLNIPTMSQVTLALGLIFSPVAYLAESSVHKGLAEIIENIHANADYLRTVERSILVRTVFMMLLAAVVCLKHEGFREEREWRAIYAPKFWPSTLMESSTEIISGIPQIVYKIPLDAKVSDPQWSPQNRPTVVRAKPANGRGRGLSCSILQPPVEASLFLCANSGDRI